MSKKHYTRKLRSDGKQTSSSIPNKLLQVSTTVIKLNGVRIGGIAGASGKAGDVMPVIVRAAITSDERDFYQYIDGVSNIISAHASKAGITIPLDSLPGFVLVVHDDTSADLYLKSFDMAIEILAKRSIKAGESVYSNDIGDIRRVRYPNIPLARKDKVFICFKVGWKFGMFFDLQNNRDLDIDSMELHLGTLYRRLRYQALYEALADESTVERMTQAGWFPFIEIIGEDLNPLLKAYQLSFDIEGKEKALVSSFDAARIDLIAERWWRNSTIFEHKTVLQAGLVAFKRGDFVSCLKVITTEIEGVLADLHLADKGSNQKIKELLRHLADKGVKKSGNESSLLFPNRFLQYLQKVTYADFDPSVPTISDATRNTVGHGYARGDAYTATRALQVILTLDQIAFYL